MGDQLSRFERIRLRVFYRSRNTCCLSLHRRTQAEFRLPTSRFTTSPDRFSWESIAYWRYFLEASVVPSLHRLRSHRKCGVLSLCIPKNWIELHTEAAKKNTAMTAVFLSLVDGFFFAGQSNVLSAVVFFFVACAEFQLGVLLLLRREFTSTLSKCGVFFSGSHVQLSPKTLENVRDVAIFSLS